MKSGLPRRKTAVITILLAGLTLSCSAHKQPSKVETALANMAKDVVIPMEAESRKNPVPDNAEASEQGGQVYMQSCALCHGADGHARTDIGRGMYPPAMDLTSPHAQHWTDAQLFWIIQNGVRMTGMPSWKSILSEDDTWKLARFLHRLPKSQAVISAKGATGMGQPGTETAAAPKKSEAERIAYGKTLYRQEGCFMCHQLNGEGGKVGPDLTEEGTRGRDAAWLVGHFKNPPAYTKGSMMPPFENLTDEQLQALTAFLLSQKGPKP